MATIAIDLDEVLAETTDAFLTYYDHTINGTYLTKDLITSYNFEDIPGLSVSSEQLAELFLVFLSGSQHTIPPLEGAHDKLQQRKNDGHKLYVVTARNECLLSPTIQRVETHFANLIEDIYFANHDNEHSIPKSGICKQIGATFMIEDHLDYALELTENNIKAYLLAKPRNHHFDPTVHDGITKVDNWGQIKAGSDI